MELQQNEELSNDEELKDILEDWDAFALEMIEEQRQARNSIHSSLNSSDKKLDEELNQSDMEEEIASISSNEQQTFKQVMEEDLKRIRKSENSSEKHDNVIEVLIAGEIDQASDLEEEPLYKFPKEASPEKFRRHSTENLVRFMKQLIERMEEVKPEYLANDEAKRVFNQARVIYCGAAMELNERIARDEPSVAPAFRPSIKIIALNKWKEPDKWFSNDLQVLDLHLLFVRGHSGNNCSSTIKHIFSAEIFNPDEASEFANRKWPAKKKAAALGVPRHYAWMNAKNLEQDLAKNMRSLRDAEKKLKEELNRQALYDKRKKGTSTRWSNIWRAWAIGALMNGEDFNVPEEVNVTQGQLCHIYELMTGTRENPRSLRKTMKKILAA